MISDAFTVHADNYVQRRGGVISYLCACAVHGWSITECKWVTWKASYVIVQTTVKEALSELSTVNNKITVWSKAACNDVSLGTRPSHQDYNDVRCVALGIHRSMPVSCMLHHIAIAKFKR